MNLSICLIRILAILLIINQHMTAVRHVQGTAFGGYLGNSIFFLISGWGLANSFYKGKPSASQWYTKRFLKLVIMISVIISIINIPNPAAILAGLEFHLVPYPLSKSTGFIPNIVVIYIFSFFILRMREQYIKLVCCALALSPAFIFPIIPAGSRLVEFTFPINAFLCFMLGCLAKKAQPELSSARYNTLLPVSLATVCIFGLHVLLQKTEYRQLASFYVTLLEAGTIYFLVHIVARKIDFSSIQDFLVALSTASLAIYLVHFHILNTYVKLGLFGIINSLQALALSLAIGMALNRAAMITYNKVSSLFATPATTAKTM